MKNIAKFCLWVLAFVPLVFGGRLIFPYTSSKSIFIQTLLALAGIFITIEIFRSKHFRQEISNRIGRMLRNPLFLSVTAFTIVLISSTIFAVDKHLAFWGNLERVEGLSMMIFLFAFLMIASLIFEENDWMVFFHISLFSTVILISREFVEYFAEGIARPGSYAGNPAFLAGYLLFSITAGLIVLRETRNRFIKYYVTVVILLATIGIFLSQTRGTILGLMVGGLACLIYSAIKGGKINFLENRFRKNNSRKNNQTNNDKNSDSKSFLKINLQKISIVLLVLGIIFSVSFVLTRKNEIWQGIPGLARLAQINLYDEDDPSTAVRMFGYRASIEALKPTQNGWDRLILGWGPENYILANSRYYEAGVYKYDPTWFDRAHNKILDTLVMTGILGLLAYIGILFFAFRFLLIETFKRENFSLKIMAIYFFITAYLVHIMFAFDQVITFIPFYTILAMIIYQSLENDLGKVGPGSTKVDNNGSKRHKKAGPKNNKNWPNSEILTASFLTGLTAFMCFVYVADTFPGYLQMRRYYYLTTQAKASAEVTAESGISPNITTNITTDITTNINTDINTSISTKSTDLAEQFEKVFSPHTTAQSMIRRKFLEFAKDRHTQNPTPQNLELLEMAILKAEQYLESRPLDISFKPTLASVYNSKGRSMDNDEYLERAKTLLDEIIAVNPGRPDIKYALASNLLAQGDGTKAFILYESTFDTNELILDKDKSHFESVYEQFVKYFYDQRDLESLIKVADRLRENNYAKIDSLDEIIDYIKTHDEWPIVKFN